MAAFRILNAFPVYLDQSGLPASGGTLAFYESGTTTPKSVYGDPGLTINNGSVIGISSDGRTEHDIWGDGSYRVRLYDADGTQLAEADDVEVAGGTGTAIPALVDGYFLTNNGALLLWAPVRQMPDPTGQDGKYPVASGDSYVLQSPPEIPDPPAPDISVTTTEFRASGGGATSFYVQQGDSSAPASGSKATTASVTFAEEFNEAPRVFVTNTTGFVTQGGDVQPTVSVTSRSTTGFTVLFSTQTGESNSSNNIVSPVAFDWIAFGTITTPVDIPATP